METNPAEQENQNRKKRWFTPAIFGSNPRITLLRLTFFLLSATLFFQFILKPIKITGASMSPTYSDGEYNLVNRMAYWNSAPTRGDVVATVVPRDILIKRIIAVPGEKVAIVGGQVMINGQPLSETYVRFRRSWYVQATNLPPDFYLIIGDNRGMAQHDHAFGLAHRRQILGKLSL